MSKTLFKPILMVSLLLWLYLHQKATKVARISLKRASEWYSNLDSTTPTKNARRWLGGRRLPLLKSSKTGFLPLALFFSPFGIAILVILAIVFLAVLGFGFFLALNVLTLAGFLLVVLSAYLMIKGNINKITIAMLVLGFFILLLPKINGALSGFTLGVVLG